jgi:protein-S-isoprenylcysteine O-methyltransferase Ste14
MYHTKVVEGMNEIYVATVDNPEASSDNVFYSNHVDGPFICFPFASVYRAIIAINNNDSIQTVFPATGIKTLLNRGDVCAFDFSREVHRIEMVKKPEHFRYSLKVHYVVYPASMPWYGDLLAFLTTCYNTIARLVFLQTLQPKNIVDKLLWRFVMFCTDLFFGIVQTTGNTGSFNFVIWCAILAWFAPVEFPVFMLLTSFVHYGIYIGTYYHSSAMGDKVAFEGFKNTVMFYKAVAFFHIIWNYVRTMGSVDNIDFISIVMICVGFGLSGSAALALGLDKTYFGYELGIVKDSSLVTKFPYNVIPHPMIIGNIIGLLGFNSAGMQREYPFLIPAHIGFYTLHMLQVLLTNCRSIFK